MSEMTEEQAETFLRNFSQGGQNLHSFFTNVVQNDDTTRLGNLSKEELGMPKLPLRTYKELEVFSDDIIEDEEWASYFKRIAEVHTSTSLSKDALLLHLAVTIKKELAEKSSNAERKPNKGWFKSKNDSGENNV